MDRTGDALRRPARATSGSPRPDPERRARPGLATPDSPPFPPSRKARYTVGEVGSGGSGAEARDKGGGARDRVDAGAEAAEVDHGRHRHVLQAGLGQPTRAAAA